MRDYLTPFAISFIDDSASVSHASVTSNGSGAPSIQAARKYQNRLAAVWSYDGEVGLLRILQGQKTEKATELSDFFARNLSDIKVDFDSKIKSLTDKIDATTPHQLSAIQTQMAVFGTLYRAKMAYDELTVMLGKNAKGCSPDSFIKIKAKILGDGRYQRFYHLQQNELAILLDKPQEKWE